MRRLRFSTAFLLAVSALRVASAAPTASPSGIVSLGEYQALVETSAAIYDKKSSVSPSGSLAGETARRLASIHQVRLPDGDVIMVDTAPQVQALQKVLKGGNAAGKSDFASFRARELRSLVSPEEGLSPLAESPGKAAQAILSQVEFRYAPPDKPAQQNWFQRFLATVNKAISNALRSFARWLEHLFGRPVRKGPTLTGLESFASFVKFLLIGLAIAGAVVGLVFLTIRFSRGGGLANLRRKRNTEGFGPLDATDAELVNPLASADALASHGEFRGAVRLVYIASLRKLAGGGLLMLQINRTNWEYQRALRGRSSVAYEQLLPATRLFDRVWYGKRPATRAEYDSIVATHNALPSGLAEVTAALMPPTGDGATP